MEGFLRAELDEIALRSQKRAAFAQSLTKVNDPATGKIALEKDELPRAPTRPPRRLAALRCSSSWARPSSGRREQVAPRVLARRRSNPTRFDDGHRCGFERAKSKGRRRF